jgi:hypothetical protein
MKKLQRADAVRESDNEIEELARVRFVPLVTGLPRDGGEISEPDDNLAYEEFAVK